MQASLKSLSSKVRMDCRWAESNPHMADMPDGSYHYRVTLKYRGRQMTIPFSCGPAWTREPSSEDVLECLLSDASSADQSFEDWASDLGVDTDSRKAERTYRICVAQTDKLRRLLGADLATFLSAERN